MKFVYKIAGSSLVALLVASSVSVAQQAAENNTQSGSLTGAIQPPAAQAVKPAAGSLSGAKPSAGSLTIGKPSAGSLSAGKPGAGSLAVGVSAGSLSSPAGRTERASGATIRRLESADDGSSYTRKPRERHTRRY